MGKPSSYFLFLACLCVLIPEETARKLQLLEKQIQILQLKQLEQDAEIELLKEQLEQSTATTKKSDCPCIDKAVPSSAVESLERRIAVCEKQSQDFQYVLKGIREEKVIRFDLSTYVEYLKSKSDTVDVKIMDLDVKYNTLSIKIERAFTEIQRQNRTFSNSITHLMEETSRKQVSCPGNYARLEVNSREFCVKFVQQKSRHIDAKAACQADGGHLVFIDTQDKQDAVVEYVRPFGASWPWIDGTRQGENWLNWNGETMNYLPWNSGQPDSSTQEGISMNKNGGYLWHDDSGDHDFICEFDIE